MESTSSDFVDFKKGKANIAVFMAPLRDAGFEANYLIRRAIGEETEGKRQFIIAMLASQREIVDMDLTAIVEFSKYLLKCNDEHKFRAWERYILYKRIVTLLNSPWHQKHGEARLLDPNSTILSDSMYQPLNRNENNYLESMKSSFFEQFDHDEIPILLMFSYFIPCTLHDHQCSRLINEYASKNDQTIIIAYETIFRETDYEIAINAMSSNNVFVLPRKYITNSVNKEILRLFPAAERRNENSIVENSVCTQFFRNRQLIRKLYDDTDRHYRKYRKSEEIKPYRDCRNRRMHYGHGRDKNNEIDWSDEYNECS